MSNIDFTLILMLSVSTGSLKVISNSIGTYCNNHNATILLIYKYGIRDRGAYIYSKPASFIHDLIRY